MVDFQLHVRLSFKYFLIKLERPNKNQPFLALNLQLCNYVITDIDASFVPLFQKQQHGPHKVIIPSYWGEIQNSLRM